MLLFTLKSATTHIIYVICVIYVISVFYMIISIIIKIYYFSYLAQQKQQTWVYSTTNQIEEKGFTAFNTELK